MKLELFGRYLYDYLTIVGAKQRRFGHLELTVIDAFSGGGKFRSLERTEDDVKGSPLVLIDAAERARAALHEGAQGPQLDWNVRFVFNDVAPEHTAYLKTALKDEGIDPSDDEFTILTGTFESNLERMIAEVQKVSPRSGRSIWLLDQTGWNGATLQSIARILAKLPRSEIILTLALDNLLRLAINNPSSQATLERVGFSKSVLDEIRQGGDPKHAGAIGQRALMDEILRRTRPADYSCFILHPNVSGRAIALVHLVNHDRARDAMVDLQWALEGAVYHFGGKPTNILSYHGLAPGEQENALDLRFAESEREWVRSKLIDDILAQFRPTNEKTPLEVLAATYRSRTPVTKDDIWTCLSDAIVSGQLDLVDAHGGTIAGRKPKLLQHMRGPNRSDLAVKRCAQRSIIFP